METYRIIPNPYPTLPEMLARIEVGDRVAAGIRANKDAHGFSEAAVRATATRIGTDTGRKFSCAMDRDTMIMYVTRTA